jgi:hypothetical protein
MIGLCRDYHWALFKVDGVCGQLRPEHVDDFVEMMQGCRKYSPDLILLNHRLNLGKGLDYATTSLWEGAETYIDVHMSNHQTGTHHRVGALARGVPPQLERLVEDHGVCLSSCMDGWDDDLVLQAFNRCLILAPEIYGNPWLLRDDEFPKLARIYNLHRRYRDILVNGMVLSESVYGPHAVSRGDDSTRILTLRNLTWDPVTYQVKLNESIGLAQAGNVEVRRFHPHEQILGRFSHGDTVAVEVPPFRSCLLMASVKPCPEVGVEGCEADVIRDVPGRPVVLKLMGLPGSKAKAVIHAGHFSFTKASLDGKPVRSFSPGKPLDVSFKGRPLAHPWHRKLADLTPCDVPPDAEALYEATCFAADNDALEARSLRRAGPTRIPAVQKSRDEFFSQALFKSRGCWDRVLFDADLGSAFVPGTDRWRGNPRPTPPPNSLRLDLGAPTKLDRLVIHLAGGKLSGIVECSTDLISWSHAVAACSSDSIVITPPAGMAVRYVRLDRDSLVPTEVEATRDGKPIPRDGWRASNLFAPYSFRIASAAWTTTVSIDEAAPGAYLCIALDGDHGVDGAWVAARLHGKPIGCPDRAVSFDSNVWETDGGGVRHTGQNYTYYLPITPEMIGQKLDIVALTLRGGKNSYKPSAWITSQNPMVSHELVLE